MTPGDLLAGRIKAAVERAYGGRFVCEVLTDIEWPHESHAYVCWPGDGDQIEWVKAVVVPGIESTWDSSIDFILELIKDRRGA